MFVPQETTRNLFGKKSGHPELKKINKSNLRRYRTLDRMIKQVKSATSVRRRWKFKPVEPEVNVGVAIYFQSQHEGLGMG